MADRSRSDAFCSVLDWVTAQDAEFADAIRECCLEGALKRSRVTFLFPDKKYRAEISEVAMKKDADYERAARMIESLIIPRFLPNGEAFASDPVGSLRRVAYPVGKTTGKTVTLDCKDGAVELKLAEEFRARRADSQMAVWHVVKGRPPVDGEPFKPRKVGGGAECDIALSVARCAVSAHCNRLGARADGFLPYVASLILFLQGAYPELYQRVEPLLDYEPAVTFFLLLQPYKRAGERLLSHAVLKAWCASGSDKTNPPLVNDHRVLKAAVEAAAGRVAAPDRDGARLSILNSTVTKDYCAAYRKHEAATGAEPCQKQWQDEFRFMLGTDLALAREKKEDTAGLWQEVEACWPGDDWARETFLSKPLPIDSKRIPTLIRFIKSSDFLYTPTVPKKSSAFTTEHRLDDHRIYDRAAVALAYLETLPQVKTGGWDGGAMSREDLVHALQVVKETEGVAGVMGIVSEVVPEN